MMKCQFKLSFFFLTIPLFAFMDTSFAQGRIRDFNLNLGVFDVGKYNAITDVAGVKVGHTTLIGEGQFYTGVTAILPYDGNIFQKKVPAGIYVGNGFGKLAGISQVQELGLIETPIVLTNTLSVAAGIEGVVRYTLNLSGNEQVRSVNAVVGETNDGYLNDIRGMHVTSDHVIDAIRKAENGPVAEGSVGAGTGTVAFGYKGGIGTSSRVLPQALGGYTVGVLVQTNFGGDLRVGGMPMGETIGKFPYSGILKDGDGSCMIVVATDAPVDARNLERMAARGMLGLARTGGYASNGSGDYVVAFSTQNRVPYTSTDPTTSSEFLRNDAMSPLFLATVECTEEAILNSMFAATVPKGIPDDKIKVLPKRKIIDALRSAGIINNKSRK